MSESSALFIELGGTLQGAEYDTLNIVGSASLAGTIDVNFISGYTPSGGVSFTILTTSGLTDNGYTLSLPILANPLLEWEVSETATSLNLEVGYINSVEGFRAQYGLAADGSDDALDWSGNGIANILYLAFGLGDPNQANVDRTRLPAIENESNFGDYAFSYVQPKTDVGLSIQLFTTNDLTGNFVDPDTLSPDHQPVETETESLDQDYERITQHFDFVNGEDQRFYRINVIAFTPGFD